jgi:hypothetical protein
MFRRDWLKAMGAGLAGLLGARKAEALSHRPAEGQPIESAVLPTHPDQVTIIRTRPIPCDYLPLGLHLALLGTVNDASFGPFPAGTVRFCGFDSERSFRSDGSVELRLQYWFVQRTRPWNDRRLGERHEIYVDCDGLVTTLQPPAPRGFPSYRTTDYGRFFPDPIGLLEGATLTTGTPIKAIEPDWG